MTRNNIWIAASDGNTSQVLAYLSEDPSLVNKKDENGYTPIHAAASYGHRELLRRLCTQHGGDANVTDDDGDTPLHSCEDVETARMLVEELGCNWRAVNGEGKTAATAIEEDGAFLDVSNYLRSLENHGPVKSPGPPPPGVQVDVRSVEVEESPNMMTEPVDEEFRRRIEELASRPGDFNTPDKQRDLKSIVTDAVQRHVYDEVDVEKTTSRLRQ